MNQRRPPCQTSAHRHRPAMFRLRVGGSSALFRHASRDAFRVVSGGRRCRPVNAAPLALAETWSIGRRYLTAVREDELGMARTDDLACKYSIVIVVFSPHRPIIGPRFPPDVDVARAGAVKGEVVSRLVSAFLNVEGDSYGWRCEQHARGGRRERTCR